MKTRSKVLVAAALATAIGVAGVAATANADVYNNWRGWGMGNMMGMHGPMMMGRWGGDHHRDMRGLRNRLRNFADRYDTAKNGKITQAEIDANRADWFKKYDANGDGKLSIDEYQNLWLAEHHRQMVRAFQHLDIDGTGDITLNDYQRPYAHIVERLDQNGDGVLSRADLQVWRERHRSHWGMMQRKDQSRMPMMHGDDDAGNRTYQQQQQ